MSGVCERRKNGKKRKKKGNFLLFFFFLFFFYFFYFLFFRSSFLPFKHCKHEHSSDHEQTQAEELQEKEAWRWRRQGWRGRSAVSQVFFLFLFLFPFFFQWPFFFSFLPERLSKRPKLSKNWGEKKVGSPLRICWNQTLLGGEVPPQLQRTILTKWKLADSWRWKSASLFHFTLELFHTLKEFLVILWKPLLQGIEGLACLMFLFFRDKVSSLSNSFTVQSNALDVDRHMWVHLLL